MVSHWSLSDSKSPQVSRTLLSILADFNNAVIWMVSTRPPISESFSPWNNHLVTVPRAPITFGITATFMFNSFFQFPSKLQVLILLFAFFLFYSVANRDSKVHNSASYLFFCWILLSGLLAEMRWSVWISKSHRSLCIYKLCIYHLFVG